MWLNNFLEIFDMFVIAVVYEYCIFNTLSYKKRCRPIVFFQRNHIKNTCSTIEWNKHFNQCLKSKAFNSPSSRDQDCFCLNAEIFRPPISNLRKIIFGEARTLSKHSLFYSFSNLLALLLIILKVGRLFLILGCRKDGVKIEIHVKHNWI